MIYKLNKVVSMLATHLVPAALLQKKRPEKYLSALAAKITTHLQELQPVIADDASFIKMNKEQRRVSSKNVPDLIHRLSFLQRDTTRALNVLFKIVWTKHAEEYDELSGPVRSYYYEIFCALRKVLLQAHKAYGLYWNADGLVPHFYRRNRWREAKRAVRDISMLLEEHRAPYSLVFQLINLPTQIFVPSIPFTYKHLRAMTNYRLKSRIAYRDLSQAKGPIMSVFFWLPIPSHHLLEEYSDTAKHFAGELETPQQQLAFYNHQVQSVGEALLFFADSHDNAWTAAMANINTWLTGRITYLEKAIAHGWVTAAPATADSTTPGKVRLNLTSHELALLLRFAVEAGLIEHTNFSDLTKMLIPYIKSFDANVQFESLRTQSKNMNEKVIGKLEDKLAELGKRMAKGKREG